MHMLMFAGGVTALADSRSQLQLNIKVLKNIFVNPQECIQILLSFYKYLDIVVTQNIQVMSGCSGISITTRKREKKRSREYKCN